MKVLILNCGSSSLKYQLFNMDGEKILAKGLVDKIGIIGSVLEHRPTGHDKIVIEEAIPNHSVAIKMMIDALIDKDYGVISDMKEIEAIGHRVVHGGASFFASAYVNEHVIEEIRNLVELAPLHNPPSLSGIEACQKILPGVPMVAVFDTAFHQTIPKEAYMYALPYEYYEKYGIRRYGFHGTSHRYVCDRVAKVAGQPIEELKIITCHLGNGSSIAAINQGKVINTSMGFTPLAGLIMGTRCGDIDPAIVPILMEKECLGVHQMSNMMNKKSGMLGISGISSDVRHLQEEAEKGNERAQLALEMFTKYVIHYIGAYAAELNGVDLIAFTAGIGENAVKIRENICKTFTYIGVDIDEEANNNHANPEREITKAGSKTRVFVIPTNEELMIARDTIDIINGGN